MGKNRYKKVLLYLSAQIRNMTTSKCINLKKRMFQIIRRKCPGSVQNWVRFSDGCTSQFRSWKVNADLLKSRKDFVVSHISFQYFEANEGKNLSDSIGSIVKCAFQWGIMKNNEGITTTAEIFKIIRVEVKESTEKFTFFIVEELEVFSRGDTEEGYPLAGILGIHSLTVHHEGILAQKLSCRDCKPSGLCPGCTEAQPLLAINLSASEEHDPSSDAGKVQDEEDDGPFDLLGNDEDEEESQLTPGDVVLPGPNMVGHGILPKYCSVTSRCARKSP